MVTDDLYALAVDIQKEKNWIFSISNRGSQVCIDVLDWEDEYMVHGAMFDGVDEAIVFLESFRGGSHLFISSVGE